jgi:hypothetical protein
LFASVLPALAIYVFYHPVLEVAMRGRTPGKRMAGVRLVTRTGDIPGVGALLLRNVFRFIDSLPTFYVVGLVSVVMTTQHVRIGDLAAGTVLVFEGAEDARALERVSPVGGLDPKAADLAQELLERWTSLAEPTRSEIARSLLARLQPQAAESPTEDAAQLRDRLQRVLQEDAAA